MKLNKNKIIQIALSRFHDRSYKTVYDCFVDALEVYLDQEKLKIVTLEEYCKIQAKKHQELSKILD